MLPTKVRFKAFYLNAIRLKSDGVFYYVVKCAPKANADIFFRLLHPAIINIIINLPPNWDATSHLMLLCRPLKALSKMTGLMAPLLWTQRSFSRCL